MSVNYEAVAGYGKLFYSREEVKLFLLKHGKFGNEDDLLTFEDDPEEFFNWFSVICLNAYTERGWFVGFEDSFESYEWCKEFPNVQGEKVKEVKVF